MVDSGLQENYVVEYWVQCPYPYSGYEVSNHGRVRNRSNNHLMDPRFNDSGYYRVHVLKDDGADQDARVHRLVCLAFHGQPQEGQTDVNHINEIKTDDRPYNLNWMTRYENNKWGTRDERARKSLKEYYRKKKENEQLRNDNDA